MNQIAKPRLVFRKPWRWLAMFAANLLLVASASSALAQGVPAIPQSAAPGAPSSQTRLLKPISIPGMCYSNKVPVNFPLPLYPSNVVHQAFINPTKGQPRASLSIVTRDAPATVFQFYLDRCKEGSWKVQVPSAAAMNSTGKAGKVFVAQAKKDGQKMDILCVASPHEAGTLVNINFVKY